MLKLGLLMSVVNHMRNAPEGSFGMGTLYPQAGTTVLNDVAKQRGAFSNPFQDLLRRSRNVEKLMPRDPYRAI